jgi:hypothetical protein
MATRRAQRGESGPSHHPRRRRRSSGSWGGVIGLAVGVGALVLITVVAKNLLESRAEPVNGAGPPHGEGTPSSGAGSPDRPAASTAPVPDRPAPELSGQVIILADALFQDAKSLHAAALRAKESGETQGYTQGIEDCRHKFTELDRLFEEFTSWLAEAKQKDWPIPRAYDTLERRQARYSELRDRLPAR